MKYDFITIGGATEDITIYTNEGRLIDNRRDLTRQRLLGFEFGAKIEVEKSFSSFGGGAANTAVNFSRLGFNTATFIYVGDDERSKRIIENFRKQRVKTNLIKKIKKTNTGFSFVLVGPGNEHILFSERAANSLLSINKSDLSKFKNVKWIYISSLSGNWREVLKKIYSIENVNIAWNPGGAQLKAGASVLKKFIKQTKVFCLNKDEAIELVLSDQKYKKKTKKFFNNARNLERVIKSWGAEIVVVTKGKYGADVYDGECFYHQNIIKEKKRIDTTGVGDAFNSSFVAGLELYKGDIKKAMKLGLKNTASVIAEQGAQNGLLSKKDI